MMKIINNLKQLKKRIDKNHTDYFILLTGGIRSSKYITSYDPWIILNEIDDTEDTYETDKQLKKEYPFLYEAIRQGAFYEH